MQKMNILLTGASGYVGQAFLKEFGHKYSIRVIGRTPIEGSIVFIKGDIRILMMFSAQLSGSML
jgi:nucleoside-diphosphate-sugar epimerase